MQGKTEAEVVQVDFVHHHENSKWCNQPSNLHLCICCSGLFPYRNTAWLSTSKDPFLSRHAALSLLKGECGEYKLEQEKTKWITGDSGGNLESSPFLALNHRALNLGGVPFLPSFSPILWPHLYHMEVPGP